MMSLAFHTRRRFAGFLLLFAGLSLGCHRGEKPPEEKVPPAPVKWEGARQLFLEEWTELVGTTQPLPEHAARVTAPVEGRVVSVLQGAAGKAIVEGQPVQKGDVLVQLDATVTRNHRDKAVAAKKVLQAKKQTAEFAVKQAELAVEGLNELQRQQDARQGNTVQLVSQIEMKTKKVALEAAKASVNAVDSELEAADQEIASFDHELQLFTLTAPRTGRLGRLQVVVGQTLPVGTVVAEIVDIDDAIDVLCFVPAVDARKLQLGQTARIGSVEGKRDDTTGSPGADPEGKVEYIADQAETETGTLAVKVRFPNRDLKLRANAVVRIRILTRPGKACWAVPESAVFEDQDPPVVVVVEDVQTKKNADGKDEDVGKARRLRAVLGVRDRVLKQVEILRLEDPEKKWHGDLETALIVVEKGQGLQTGDEVRLEVDEDEEMPPMPKPDEKKP
jgi:RND family efflux transporter MFP subunit